MSKATFRRKHSRNGKGTMALGDAITAQIALDGSAGPVLTRLITFLHAENRLDTTAILLCLPQFTTEGRTSTTSVRVSRAKARINSPAIAPPTVKAKAPKAEPTKRGGSRKGRVVHRRTFAEIRAETEAALRKVLGVPSTPTA